MSKVGLCLLPLIWWMMMKSKVMFFMLPLYWLGAYFIPQQWAYFIAGVATVNLIVQLRFESKMRAEYEKQYAKLLHDIKRYL